MLIFNRFKKNKPANFFEKEPADRRFKLLNELVSTCSTKRDCEKLKNAVDNIFEAQQKTQFVYEQLGGFRGDEKLIDEDDGFLLHEKDGEV